MQRDEGGENGVGWKKDREVRAETAGEDAEERKGR